MRRGNAAAFWKLERLEREEGPWKKDVQDAPAKASSQLGYFLYFLNAMHLHPGSLKDLKERKDHERRMCKMHMQRRSHSKEINFLL
jgi:hypothetical protein